MHTYDTVRPREDGRIRAVAALAVMAMVASLVMIGAAAQAVHDADLFELEKNASNDYNVAPVGYLASNIGADATTINVCQTGVPASSNDTILIRAERLTVTDSDPGTFGGNCAGDKMVYAVARGVDGTTAAAQSGGANNVGAAISLLTEVVDKPGTDWDQIYDAWSADAATACASLGLIECTFIEDGIGPTTFTGGNTKDHLPISGWKHTSGASPDKGEILNAYAAKGIDGDDQILYFGMDRYAVDGSTDIGFWFFQSQVSLNEDGTFSGNQQEGDVLILATFTQGGATTSLRVFEWVDSGGSELPNIDGPDVYGDCVKEGGSPADGDDSGCATVNNTTIEVPWEYTFKGAATSGWIPAGGFFEGGLNLTEAGLDGCFSTFMAETRSSPELTAVLKDFALGDFEACDSSLTTTPSDGNGTALTDGDDEDTLPEIQIGTGDSGVMVTDRAVLDIKGTSEWSGTLSFYLCGPIATGTCDTGGVQVGVGRSISDEGGTSYWSDPAKITEVGRYCWRGEFDSDTEGVPDATDSSEGECFEVLPVTPTLTTTAVADAEGNALTGPVPFGTAVYDKATLSGTAYAPGDRGDGGPYPSINAAMTTEAGGTITFKLVALGESACGADAAGNWPESENGMVYVDDGDGDYPSLGFTPSAPGNYTWQATYSGDNPNTLGTSHNDDCDETAEHVTVQQLQPTLGTAQRFVPNDSATVTVDAGAGDLDGTVTFKLYVGDATCTDPDALKYEKSFDVDATDDGTDPLTDTVSSDNTTAYTASTSFYWVVTFESDNTAHKDVTSGCGVETSSISIDNGVTQPPPPSGD